MSSNSERKGVLIAKANRGIELWRVDFKTQRTVWNWTRCILLLLLCALCSGQVSAQGAIEKCFIPWPQLKDGFFPQISEDGHRVVVRVGLRAQVWELEADGQVGKMLWDSGQPYPKLVAHGLTWLGEDLILSLGDNHDPLYRLDVFDTRDMGKLPVSKGTTILIDFPSGKAKRLLEKSYRYLTVDPTHKYLAGATPTDMTAKDAVIEFYKLDGPKAELSGRFEKKGWGYVNTRPYISGWSRDSQGVYVIGKRDRVSAADLNAYEGLFHIALDGKRSEILPKNATVTPLRRGAPPLAFPLRNQDLSVHIQYLSEGGEYVIINLEGMRKSMRFVEGIVQGEVILNGKVIRPQALAMTPNERFIVFQDLGRNLDPPLGYQVNLWLLDIKSKRVRMLGHAPTVNSVRQWNGNKLLIEIDDNTGKSHALGLIHIAEATAGYDDSRLDTMVAQAPWEDWIPASPPKSTP